MRRARDGKARGPGLSAPLGVGLGLAAVVALAGMVADPWTSYGQQPPTPPADADGAAAAAKAVSTVEGYSGGGMAASLLQVPVSNLIPGGVPVGSVLVNPVGDDPQALARGMNYFNQFNCSGCHAANGAGGMGPALSNKKFIYGSSPGNIYLSILHGRPNGMPAWGAMLPDSVIWDLVAYVKSLSKAPSAEWGKTVSPGGFTIEQVPAENIKTADPWGHTERFSYGQAPAQHGEPAPPSGGK